MTDEEITEITDTLNANNKTMKNHGISDNLWGKAVECIEFLQVENSQLRASLEAIEALKAENVALHDRLNRAIELPFFQKDEEVIVLIYKNKGGVVLTETYFEDEYYDGKRGNEVAETRFAELKGEK